MKKSLFIVFVLAFAVVGVLSFDKTETAEAGYYYTSPAPYTHPWSSTPLGFSLGGNYYNGYNSYYPSYSYGSYYPSYSSYSSYPYYGSSYYGNSYYPYSSGYGYGYGYGSGYGYGYGSSYGNYGYNPGGWYGGVTFSW